MEPSGEVRHTQNRIRYRFKDSGRELGSGTLLQGGCVLSVSFNARVEIR